MRLVASLIVRNELGRYLAPCLDHLLEFCDHVVVLDDGSTELYDERGRPTDDPDGLPWEIVIRDLVPGAGDDRLLAAHAPSSAFFEHEGRARQALLDLTVDGLAERIGEPPSHVLAVDADEFVADGFALRYAIERNPAAGAWNLCMREVWNATEGGLEVRQDGGWDEHDVAVVWRPDAIAAPLRRIADRQLACGRVPQTVGKLRKACGDTALLHFGWTSKQERRARYERYAVHDGGRFHQNAHLESIMWPDDRVTLTDDEWPSALAPYKAAILGKVTRA